MNFAQPQYTHPNYAPPQNYGPPQSYALSAGGQPYHQTYIPPHHLPPITLQRVSPCSRRCKAAVMFLAACVGSAIFPSLIILIALSAFMAVGDDNIVVSCWMEHEITMWESWVGFGEFSFRKAKAIDVMFNLIVGSGGQLLMGYITFVSHISVLGHVMETSPVSYELFTTMLFTGTSGPTFLALFRRVFSTNIFLPKMIWLFLSTGYVLSFGNLIGAMTRYRSNTEPVVVLQGGSLIPLKIFVSETTVYYANVSQAEGAQMTFREWTLLPFTDSFRSAIFELNGTTYDTRYIQGACLDRGQHPTYNYGFTGWILLLMCILQFMWCFGTYFVWTRANKRSLLKQAGREMGTYRGIIDLGEALAEDLGTNTGAYSNSKLEKVIQERNIGLSYFETHDAIPHIGISSRNNPTERVSLRRGNGTQQFR